MIKLTIEQNNEVKVNDEVQAVIIATIINETEEGYEGGTILMMEESGVSTLAVLQSLATLVANSIKNDTDDKEEMLEMFSFVGSQAMEELMDDAKRKKV